MFYASGGSFEVRGEAKAVRVLFLTPQDIISLYENRLFITKKELESYRSIRSNDRKLAVFEMTEIQKYENPAKLQKQITISGKRISEEEYRIIRSPTDYNEPFQLPTMI